jgi:glutamyl-tRNA synthetase
MRNYLTRLGWSHGNSEFFSDEDAKHWFDLEHIGRSPSRFDFKKLANISGQHIAQTTDTNLLTELEDYLKASNSAELTKAQKVLFLSGAYCVKQNAKTLTEVYEKSTFLLNKRPILLDENAKQNIILLDADMLQELTRQLQSVTWDRPSLEKLAEVLVQSRDMKLGKLVGPLRAALSGRAVSPSIFDMMLVLGRDETIARLKDASLLARI